MIQATEYGSGNKRWKWPGESCIFYICDGEILDGKSEPRKELNQDL